METQPPPPPVQPPPPASGPSGLGGWLGLVVLGQTIGPVRTLAETLMQYARSESVLEMPGGDIAVFGELAMNFALFAVQVWAMVLMYARRRFFPKAFLIEWLLGIAIFVGDVALVSTALRIPVDQIIGEGSNLIQSIAPLVVQGLWCWYLFASRRSRNTFVR